MFEGFSGPAPKGRKIVAHGVSRGEPFLKPPAPEGRKNSARRFPGVRDGFSTLPSPRSGATSRDNRIVFLEILGAASVAVWLYLLLARGGFWRLRDAPPEGALPASPLSIVARSEERR